MSIKKMMHGLLSILVLISFVSAVGTFAVLNHNQGNGKVVNYSGIVRGASQRLVKLYILGEDTGNQVQRVQNIIVALNNGDEALGIPVPTDKHYIAKMKEVQKEWENSMLVNLTGTYSPAKASALLKASEMFFVTTDDAVKAAEIFTEKGIIVLKVMSVITFLLILVCAFVISFIIRSRITNPIRKIEMGMIEFSKGELKTEIDYHSDNELGRLADSIRFSMDTLRGYIEDIDKAMHEMSAGNFTITTTRQFVGDFKGIETSISSFILKISNTFQQLNMASDQVYAGSAQVSAAALSLAQGAIEQASSVQELSNAVSNISMQVKENAGNSLKASELANAAMVAVMDSDTHMHALMETMDQMNSMSSAIGKIVKTIEDIAFQTNILALNAAVEAARAGAAGKGFAVVANEVRNLSSKSTEAAKNTAILIEKSLMAIRTGVSTARETAAGLQQIMADTKATQKMVSNISNAGEAQASFLADTATRVEQITNVINSNSATSEESAAASQELSQQADLMKVFIGQFKVKNTAKVKGSGN